MSKTTCVIQKNLPNGMVLVALATRSEHALKKAEKNRLQLNQQKEFAAKDLAEIEAYKTELFQSLTEPICLPTGNLKRKNSAHLTSKT